MSKKILVIDDEESIRMSFELALEDFNYKVVTAFDGQDGIEKFNKEDFDLVFTDLKMPRKKGTDVIEEIRKQNNEVIIYVVTAFHKEFLDELNYVREKNYNFELLRKPIGMIEIINIVQSVLED